MSLVVLGLSHHGALLSLLESVALDPDARTALEQTVLCSEHVTEAVVVSTCNRTEVYAECLTFHGALTDITAALAEDLFGRPGRPAAAPVRALRGPRYRPRVQRRLGAWTRWPSARPRSSVRCAVRLAPSATATSAQP